MDTNKLKELYCLAELKDSKWKCVYSNISASGKMLKFKIEKDGTYAVVFNPSMKIQKVRKGVFCGLACKERRILFILIFIIMPILFAIVYLFYYIF